MEPLALTFLLCGGGLLALIAILIALVHRERRRVAARAAELLRHGASPQQTQQQLVAEGVDPKQTAEAVRQATVDAAAASAAEMLKRGASEKEAREELSARGLDSEAADDVVHDLAHPPWARRHPVASVMLGLPLMALGAGVVVAGLILRDGNLTGRFVTFPFAGGLTIMAGVILLVFGLALTVVPFTKAGYSSTKSD